MQCVLVLASVGLLYCAHAQDLSSASTSESSSSSSSTSSSSTSSSSSSSSASSSSNSYCCNEGNSESSDGCMYPCGNTPTLDCVRDYFINSGQCRPVTRLMEGEIIIRKKQPVYIPFVNLTVVTKNGEIKHEDVDAEKFFINTKTNNLVLDICLKKISFCSKNTDYIIYRRGLEPIKFTDFVDITYTGCLTVVVPVNQQRIMMNSATTSAFITDAYPAFEVGPKFSASSDELIAQTYDALLTGIPTAVKEIFLTDAHSYFFGYFQNYICCFGVPYST